MCMGAHRHEGEPSIGGDGRGGEMISCMHVCFPLSLAKRIAGLQLNGG